MSEVSGPPPPRSFGGPGKPDCPICRGVGYIAFDVPVGHPQFGQIRPCTCRLDELQTEQAAYLHKLAALGPLRSKTFDNFMPEGNAVESNERASLKRAFDTCLRFAREPRGWLLLYGSYGVGKTHLAAAIANERIALGEQVVFLTTPDLLDHLRATFAPDTSVQYDELFDRVRNIDLLVLDDLGAESPTPWAMEKLYQLINHRYVNELPTVVTSNVELERIDPRIRSRLVDTFLVRKVIIDAPDFRGAFSDQNDLSSLELHRNQTFDNFDPRKGELSGEHARLFSAAIEAAKAFATKPEGWLVLTGPHGSGKTHLAAAVANACVHSGQPALFITFADLLDHLRATFSPDSAVRYDKVFQEVRTAPILVLDDLALDSATPWAREKLMQLIDYRYIAQLPTVVTTSIERQAMDARLETRLLDPRLATVCPITAPIYKGAGGGPRRRKRS